MAVVHEVSNRLEDLTIKQKQLIIDMRGGITRKEAYTRLREIRAELNTLINRVDTI